MFLDGEKQLADSSANLITNIKCKNKYIKYLNISIWKGGFLYETEQKIL